MEDQPTTRDPTPPVCRRHNVSAREIHGGDKERANNVGHLLRLLRSLPQPRQIHTSNLQSARGGGGAMLDYFGHTMRVSSHQIPGNTAISWTGLEIELASGDKKTVRRLEGWKACMLL